MALFARISRVGQGELGNMARSTQHLSGGLLGWGMNAEIRTRSNGVRARILMLEMGHV